MAPHFAWERPLDAAPFPNVWLKFSVQAKNSDKLVNYRVQDLPDDRFEDAIAFMKAIFIAGEPLARSIGKRIKSNATAFNSAGIQMRSNCISTMQMV